MLTNSLLKNKVILIFFSCLLWACSKPKDFKLDVDKQIYDLATDTTNFVDYRNIPLHLNDSLKSFVLDSLYPLYIHNTPFVRVRYNKTAQLSLDTNIKKASPNLYVVDTVFRNGALIVMEEKADSNTVIKYSVMYKSIGSANADANGWIWAQYYKNGTVVHSATRKGLVYTEKEQEEQLVKEKFKNTFNCNTCHSNTGNIDLTLSNFTFK